MRASRPPPPSTGTSRARTEGRKSHKGTLPLPRLAFTFMRPTDRPQFITYAISTMIVCIMCPTMSLIATLLFKEPSFGTWAHTFGCNMPMALIWQLLYCGPLCRLIFRLLFRVPGKQAAQAH